MDLFGSKLLAFVLVIACSVVSGCVSQDDLQQQQTQLLQSGTGNGVYQPLNEPTIAVTTTQGDVQITPTVVGYSPQQFDDPLEFINRPIFAFNHVLYTWVLNPLADGYTAIMPDPVEDGVSRFFSNLREPLNAINHLLQGEGSKMGSNLSRFLINSTVGILGIFDPAQAWFDIQPKKSTLNDTLTQWDVSSGAYIVLPIFGQSDVRNGFSTLAEASVAPVKYVTDTPQTTYLRSYDGFHEYAPRADSYETLYQQSDDPYLFFRNLYMQSVLRDQQFAPHLDKQDATRQENAEQKVAGSVEEPTNEQ